MARIPGRKSPILSRRDPATAAGASQEVPRVWAQDGEVLTVAASGPVDESYNSLRIGEAGTTLTDNFHLREKITHFDHKPIREPHARGAAAHGTF